MKLLNIIFGQVKTVLVDELNHKVEKVIPTVLVGEKLQINMTSTSEPTLVLPFDSSVGKFHIELLVESTG